MQTAVYNFNQQLNGEDDKDKVLALLIRHNDILAEMAHRHRRAIKFVAGEHVEPEVQFAETVLLPASGVGCP